MAKQTSILVSALLVLALSCNDKGKSISSRRTFSNSLNVQTKESLTRKHKVSQLPIGVIYQTEHILLYGDTTIEKNKILSSSTKFEPYISFDDFKVPKVDNKRYADLDLKSNKYANNFRTRLRDAYMADTTNFAGHYTFVIWGCGTECQMSMIIDRQTGKIYDSPEASCGYDFTADSRMLIVNPPDTSGFYSDDNIINCKPTIFTFDEQTKTFNERQPKVKYAQHSHWQ